VALAVARDHAHLAPVRFPQGRRLSVRLRLPGGGEPWSPGAIELLPRSLVYAAFGAVLSWSFTTIAVAAKNVMTSVPDYLVIETAFTAVQWAIVGPLTALAFAGTARKEPATA